MFFSLQGEGRWVGHPAVFLRLRGCNLTCGGIRTATTGGLDSGATWRCDTLEVWTKGRSVSFPELLQEFENRSFREKLEQGAHLVITGGEPLLQQESLNLWLEEMKETWGFAPWIEVETNGTVLPQLINKWVRQWNVSPKLENSGMPSSRRVAPEVIQAFAQDQRTLFKFVISSERDWKEVESQWIDLFHISKNQICLMPGADHRESLAQLSDDIAQLAIRNNVSFSTRLHIALWNRKTGV